MKVKKIISDNKKQVMDLHELYGDDFKFTYNYYEQLVQDKKIKSKILSSVGLWRKMLTAIYETGAPWLTFKDPINIRSPQQHDGSVHSSNLCCMTDDQRVVTDKGLLTVKELYDIGCENKVVGVNGIYNASKMVMPKENSPIVRINTQDGYSHKVTPDHKVWVYNEGWTEAQYLKKGDKLLLQQVEGMFGPEDQSMSSIIDGGNIDYCRLDNSYKIPEYIWKGNRDTVIAFLKHLYFNIYECSKKNSKKYIYLKSNRSDILGDIQILWANFNIKTSVYTDQKEQLYLLKIDFGDFDDIIYNNKYKRSMSDNYTLFDSLTILPNEDVYCLTVDSTNHSWTVNGLITKNTEITLNTKANDEVAVCFPAGTLIMTNDGLTPIEKCKNKNVYVPYNTKLKRQNKFIKPTILKQGKKEIWKIYTEDGHFIKTTENHPFLTLNNKSKCHWKTVKNLKIDDKLIIFDNTNYDLFIDIVSDKYFNHDEMKMLIFNNYKINTDHFEININDIELLRKLQIWLNLVNVDSKISTYTLKIDDKKSMTNFFNEFNNFFNNHAEIINIIHECKNETDRNFTKISHIINTKKYETVYDLSLSEDHTFVANGLVVHNCNLSAINLANHVDENGLNIEKLKETIKIAVRNLDNVIDINFYPIPEAERSNKKHRPIGLGIMGFQDVLYKLKIPYESEEAIALADQIQEIISYYAVLNSHKLSLEKGSYSSFKGSLWSKGVLALDSLKMLINKRGKDNIDIDTSSILDWDSLRKDVVKGMRNSNVTTIQPTATISNICGVTQSIEPLYQHMFVKSNLSGEFTIVNPYLIDELKKLNLWDEEMINDLKEYDGKLEHIDRIPENIKKIYKTSFEIDQIYLIECASRRQKWVDQAISLNLYLIEATGKKLDTIFKTVWKKGLKSSYYLRTMGASHIKKTTITNRPSNNFINTMTDSKSCGIDDTECESCQ